MPGECLVPVSAWQNDHPHARLRSRQLGVFRSPGDRPQLRHSVRRVEQAQRQGREARARGVVGPGAHEQPRPVAGELVQYQGQVKSK
jgi:hypothetical protein